VNMLSNTFRSWPSFGSCVLCHGSTLPQRYNDGVDGHSVAGSNRTNGGRYSSVKLGQAVQIHVHWHTRSGTDIPLFLEPSHGLPQSCTFLLPVRHSLPKIDVMVVYTPEAYQKHEPPISEQQLLSNIATGFELSDEAMVNSGVNLKFKLVRVEKVSLGVRRARVHGAWWCGVQKRYARDSQRSCIGARSCAKIAGKHLMRTPRPSTFRVLTCCAASYQREGGEGALLHIQWGPLEAFHEQAPSVSPMVKHQLLASHKYFRARR